MRNISIMAGALTPVVVMTVLPAFFKTKESVEMDGQMQ
jgi:hypothetical protein